MLFYVLLYYYTTTISLLLILLFYFKRIFYKLGQANTLRAPLLRKRGLGKGGKDVQFRIGPLELL